MTAYVYDTGSGDLTTTSKNCDKGCVNKIYDEASSTTAVKVDGSEKTLSYGSATLDGYYVKDTVCIGTKESLCVKDFTFFEIVEDTGLYFDGILGLSPIAPDKNEGSSMVQALSDAKIIDS